MAKLSLKGISKRFQTRSGSVQALDDIWLDVQDGEFVVLIGPSGCGKSTLFNIVAGLDRPDTGEVWEDDHRITGPGRDRGVVFQDGALFPWLTARKNVEFGLKQMGVPAKERTERGMHYLHLVHLARFADSNLHELSGGMRQRVAIARALALEPEVLLMDEPFSALDAQTREDLYEVLQEIWQRTRKTILFITHNVREAVCLGDRVVLLAARPGRVQATFDIPMERPRLIDDVDVARAAHQISRALKAGALESRQEEYDVDWHPSQAGVLRPADRPVGTAR